METLYADFINWMNGNPGAVIAAVVVIFVVGTLLGMGDHRKIVIFRTYDDLFLTFLVPALLFGGVMGLLVEMEGGLFAILGLLALVASLLVFLYVAFRTLQSNAYSAWRFVVAMLVKFPLALIWVLQIITLLKPGGETARQRAKSRGRALLALTFLTPVIGALVAEKTGVFSPRQVLKGRRIGSIRSHL